MIAQRSIEEVIQRADIYEVVSQFVALEKSGADYRGISPFKQEKSPSFYVRPNHGYYKCFSTGKAGGAINFLMEVQKMDFPEAITWLANKYHIEIEIEDGKEDVEPTDGVTKEQIYKVLESTARKYNSVCDDYWDSAEAPEGVKYLRDLRGLTKNVVDLFQIGVAPNDWRFISDKVVEGAFYGAAIKAGVIKNKGERVYDAFVNRTIYPIHDNTGRICGFGGRVLDDAKPKYLNSSDGPVYQKSKILYGLHQVKTQNKHIEEIFLMEGYHDVLAAHQNGLTTAISVSGTALSEYQAKMIRRHCDKITLLFDADEAGLKATRRSIEVCLPLGFRALCVVELPKGKDPANMFAENPDFSKQLPPLKQDAIIYLTGGIAKGVDEGGPMAMAEAVEDICKLLLLIENEVVRDAYIKEVCKATKIKEPVFRKEIKRMETGSAAHQNLKEDENAAPSWVDKDELYTYGFIETSDKDRAGYYFQSGKNFESVSNFIIKPLFHVMSQDDNRRVLEVNNGYEAKVIDMPSKSLVSNEMFKSEVFNLGHFNWFGTTNHLNKVLSKISRSFPTCVELRTLGHQPVGQFWAWYNAIYHNGQVSQFSKMGIADVEGQRYWSPAASTIYVDVQADEDMYEMDKHFKYIETELTIDEWSSLMHRAYDEKAMSACGFLVMATFKDVVNDVLGNNPLLSCYGQKGSGKTEFAESIVRVFSQSLMKLNLFNATDFALAKYLEVSRNTAVLLDEFDDSSIKDDRFQVIKAAFDGAGRQRGRGGSKRKTETQKFNSAVILAGQYLSQKDDNSVLSRAILLPFNSTSHSEDNKKAYNELKSEDGWEKKGITGMLVQLLKYRKEFKREFGDLFADTVKQTFILLKSEKVIAMDRVVRNYSALYASLVWLSKRFKLPFAEKEMAQYHLQEIIRVTKLISQSDALGEFWNIVEGLVDQNLLEEGWHFKVESPAVLKLSVKGQEKEIILPPGEKCLFIRLRLVHNLYMQACRKATGRNGMPLSSVQQYMENSPQFMGVISSTRFSRGSDPAKITSAMVLTYRNLQVDLHKPTGSELEPSDNGKRKNMNETIESKSGQGFEDKIEGNDPF